MAHQGGGGQGEGQGDGGGDEQDMARHHIFWLEVTEILATTVLEYTNISGGWDNRCVSQYYSITVLQHSSIYSIAVLQ